MYISYICIIYHIYHMIYIWIYHPYPYVYIYIYIYIIIYMYSYIYISWHLIKGRKLLDLVFSPQM